MLQASEITETSKHLTNSMETPKKNLGIWAWYFQTGFGSFSGNTMKPYFPYNDFFNPLKALCGHNFCTTEKNIAFFICLP